VQIEEFSIPANGFVFTAKRCGPSGGRPVVLLHGFPETSHSWMAELEALGESGFEAVAFDQRGYCSGARPDATEAYSVDHLTEDVLAVSRSLGSDRFDLVGHDWGAMVAWAIASRHPDLLRTVTVLSTPHPLAFGAALSEEGGDQQGRSSYIEVFRQVGVAERALLGEDGSGDGLRAMFAASGLENPADVDVFVDAMREPGALTAALNWYRANTVEALSGVGAITVPTMYIWSTEDIALGRTAAEATRDFVRGPYRFEVLEGVSHWIPESAPERVNELLLEFLRDN
jgi:pimeloyl-ACP methyl ester carboxylesterase